MEQAFAFPTTTATIMSSLSFLCLAYYKALGPHQSISAWFGIHTNVIQSLLSLGHSICSASLAFQLELWPWMLTKMDDGRIVNSMLF